MSPHEFMAANSPEPLLALPAPNFRLDRDCLASELSDPASNHERSCWSDLLLSKQCNDLEDPEGLYASINSKKTDSDNTIQINFDRCKTEFKLLALTHHPDKTSDPAKNQKFLDAKEVYEFQQEAFKILHTMISNESGTSYPDRFKYDQKGEELRKEFTAEFEKVYPDLSFAQRAEQILDAKSREDIYAKKRATEDENKGLSGLDAVKATWKKTGHQDNWSRYCVWKALQDGYTQADIARHIRITVYNGKKEKFAGVKMGDKIYKRIHGSVQRIHKASKEPDFRAVMGSLVGRGAKQSAMDSKSIKVGARGRKVSCMTKQVC